MNTLALKREIYKDPGYTLAYKLSKGDLQYLRDVVTQQYLDNIRKECPEHYELFESAGIENYHKHSHLVEHTKIWPKLRRCLDQDVCQRIQQLDFFKTLQRDFSPFMLGRVVYEKEVDWSRDEMYWRIVRPQQSDDVGTLHADKWFHDSMKIRERVFPEGANALKIWLPLFCEIGMNGLEIVEGSHRQDWTFNVVDIENTAKPRLGVDETQIERKLLLTPPGQMVIFNEDLVHVGAVNKGEQTRISLEITLVRVVC